MTDVAERLEELRASGLHRRLRLIEGAQGARVLLDGREVLLLCSNDYLGLAADPRVREAAAEAALRWGAGAGSSRLIAGSMEPHRLLERRLAAFKGYESALLFGSGYLANVGAISALAGRGGVVFSDELNHASIVDGCRLARAETFVYRHGDIEHLAWGLAEAGQAAALIVSDGVFSMDGDVAPLAELARLARDHDCRLMIDEAHATGALGPGGRGSVAAAGLSDEVDLVVGTLGKALGGASGGYITGPQAFVDLLRQRARPYLFSNSLAPSIVQATLAALELLEQSAELRRQLAENTAYFRERMVAAGFDVIPGAHAIAPVMTGDARLAQRLASGLMEQGVFVTAFSFPVVPKGQARVRTQMSAALSRAQIDHAIAAFITVGQQVGLIPAGENQ